MKRYQQPTAAAIAASLLLASCGGGGGSSSGGGTVPIVPPVVQSPTPAPGGGTASATCPASGAAASSLAQSGGSAQSIRRGPAFDDGRARFVPGLYTVTYRSDADASRIDGAANGAGAMRATSGGFDALGMRVHAFHVDPSHADAFLARLKTTAGVVHVEQAQYRHLAAVSVNDPYYNGFGAGAPYYETSSSPGQWDMHVINVGTAWGDYSSLPARGAAIAIVDTGVDVTHPEMKGGKVVRQACYVTYPVSAAQTTGAYAVDTDGHGTNVAGIADADTNNGFGFAGVAYDAPLLAYRIFPTTPSGGCEGSSSAQCSTTDVDEASAINDAVAHGARVINLSLGATPPCTDTIEENAVEAAISHGVVVVAAAGNESKSSLDCPAAYPGVIAVGAEGPGGSSESEVVAAYSNYISGTGTSAGGAYLIAPGGTANTGSDSDDLHFVINITSSEMPDAATYCKPDFAGEGNDCRAGFSGTSQATPHVVGVVSLMLGLRPSLTPAQIAADLCSTAHSIGDSKQGCGRLDAAAAVAKALSQ